MAVNEKGGSGVNRVMAVMDKLDEILCSYQGRSGQTAYSDMKTFGLFSKLVLSGKLRVQRYGYRYDDDVGNDEEITGIYHMLARQTRWRVGAHTEIGRIRLNALKQLSHMGTPAYRDCIYYGAAYAALVCGNLLPADAFRLFLGSPEVTRLFIFPYPYSNESGMNEYFSFEPDQTAVEKMREWEEARMEELRKVQDSLVISLF